MPRPQCVKTEHTDIYVFYRFTEEAATSFLHQTPHFSINFFSTGFVFIQGVETTSSITGVELRYAEAPLLPHSAISRYYLPMFPITRSTSWFLAQILDLISHLIFVNAWFLLIQVQVQAIFTLRKEEFYKNCKLSGEKLLIRISPFSHLVIVPFINTHDFSNLF